MPDSPFPFPTDDNPMFPTADRVQYEAALKHLREDYEKAVARVEQEWQAALNRDAKKATAPGERSVDYRTAPKELVERAMQQIRAQR